MGEYVIETSADKIYSKTIRDVLIYYEGGNDPEIYYMVNVILDNPISKRLYHIDVHYGMKWSLFKKRDPAVLLYDCILYNDFSIKEYGDFLHLLYYYPHAVYDNSIFKYIIETYNMNKNTSDLMIKAFITNFCCFIKKRRIKSATCII